jgi:MFS family permease
VVCITVSNPASFGSNRLTIFSGIVISYGVFQEFYAANYLSDYTPSDISWIGTVQAFLLFGAGALSGPLFDRGYLRELVIAGAVLMTVGIMTASVARHYYSIFLSLGLCTGIGTSLLFTPSVAVIGTYFTTRRPIAAGISATGGGVGMNSSYYLSVVAC